MFKTWRTSKTNWTRWRPRRINQLRRSSIPRSSRCSSPFSLTVRWTNSTSCRVACRTKTHRFWYCVPSASSTTSRLRRLSALIARNWRSALSAKISITPTSPANQLGTLNSSVNPKCCLPRLAKTAKPRSTNSSRCPMVSVGVPRAAQSSTNQKWKHESY